jgi:hypothetical protein
MALPGRSHGRLRREPPPGQKKNLDPRAPLAVAGTGGGGGARPLKAEGRWAGSSHLLFTRRDGGAEGHVGGGGRPGVGAVGDRAVGGIVDAGCEGMRWQLAALGPSGRTGPDLGQEGRGCSPRQGRRRLEPAKDGCAGGVAAVCVIPLRVY